MDREDVPKTKKRKVGTRIERPRGVADSSVKLIYQVYKRLVTIYGMNVSMVTISLMMPPA